MNPDAPPPFSTIDSTDKPTCGHGFEQLPAPDDGDVFVDFEGHPFWRADAGLFFLFGLLERDDTTSPGLYRTWWAHDPKRKRRPSTALVAYFTTAVATHPQHARLPLQPH